MIHSKGEPDTPLDLPQHGRKHTCAPLACLAEARSTCGQPSWPPAAAFSRHADVAQNTASSLCHFSTSQTPSLRLPLVIAHSTPFTPIARAPQKPEKSRPSTQHTLHTPFAPCASNTQCILRHHASLPPPQNFLNLQVPPHITSKRLRLPRS